MKDLVRRFAGSLRRLVRPSRVALPAPGPRPHPSGPTTRRTGERPLRGEDTQLIRPYLLAHEWRADRIAATAPPTPVTEVAA
ncbi:hypothetical protein OG599_11590 [Streptomyces sp. NBC_01335]|uniref:hypothetical protein n=1 Tax=Streptomyces sp. NBC_01335 TaxID=2903828 RepID=UPI002E12024A|nr:hypothetical protein OG599_11590 [Streptomyces sp. NBC_01335]